MNTATENNQIKQKTTLFSHRSTPTLTPLTRSPAKQETAPAQHRCCHRLNDCMGISSSTPVQTMQRPTTNLHQQDQLASPFSSYSDEQKYSTAGVCSSMKIAYLERELKRQTELKDQYLGKLQNLQDFLSHCMQIAEEYGIEENSSKYLQLSPSLSPGIIPKTSPKQLPSETCRHCLEAIRVRAKINGWYIQAHEIELFNKIGQGSTADIYRGTWRGLDVAVKCMFPEFFHSNESSHMWFAQELETLSRQHHPHVLRLMGACFDLPEKGWVVTEFLSGRTLKEWLHGQNDRRKERSIPLPPLEERIDKGLEIAQAMQYLHEQRPKVVHRDLKPSNIFLDDAMHVRVADFGYARFLAEGEHSDTGETGTYIYMAPEVFRSEPYNEKCDVFSFGIILNELVTGQYPYVDSDYRPAKIAQEVAEGRLRPTLPQDDNQVEGLIDLICQCWDENASNRPTFATITCTLKKNLENLIEAAEADF